MGDQSWLYVSVSIAFPPFLSDWTIGTSPRTPEGVTINVNGVHDHRLLWSPSLPFSNLLQVVGELNGEASNSVHGRVQGDETFELLGSLSGDTELSTPWPAHIVGPAISPDRRDLEPSTDVSYHFNPVRSGPGFQTTETWTEHSVTADSRTIVTKCFGLQLAADPAQQEHEVFSYIEPLTIDKSPGDTAKAVRALFGHPSRTNTSTLMAYVAYLASNCLIQTYDVDQFVKILLQQKDHNVFYEILAKILDSGTLIAQAFATRLLHSAVEQDACDLVAFLIDHGIEIDQLSNGDPSQTPLQCALRHGAIATATFLIENGANTNSRGLRQRREQSVSDSGGDD